MEGEAMRMSRLVIVVVAGCFAAGSLIEAQGRGHGPAGHAPQIPKEATGGPNVGGGNTGKSGNAGVTPGDSSKSRGNPRTAPGNAGDHGGNEAGRGRGNAGGDRGNGGSPPATFADKMNPKLRARLESMLPSGMTLEQAADGFRNKGQFIAALQQSQKHDVSFADLKGQMTGDNPISLGAAMRKLRVKTHED
jgi:hypothetical protein